MSFMDDDEMKEFEEIMLKTSDLIIKSAKHVIHQMAIDNEYFKDVAMIYRKTYQALLDEGFRESEAMDIVSKSNPVASLTNTQQPKDKQ